MKNLILISSILTLILISFSSCSSDFEGITFELITPDELIFSPGDEVTFEIKITDDTGIAQLDIKEPGIGLYINETYRPSESEIDYSFSVTIPSDQEDNSQIAIGLEISDEDNNVLFEQIKLSIEKE